jgi:tetratricopeptide (TPR) repeat protein
MTKLGFMPDLVRGITKLVGKEEEAPKAEAAAAIRSSAEIAPLLKRVKIFIDNNDWSSAEIYCEKILDIDPENSDAYVYKLLASLGLTRLEDLAYANDYFGNSVHYKNAIRYADEETSQRIIAYNNQVKARLQQAAERSNRKKELNASKQAVEMRIGQQVQAKRALEAQIEQAKTTGPKSNKGLAIATLVCFGLIVVSFIVMMVTIAAQVANDDTASPAIVLLPMAMIIVYMIVNGRLCRSRGASGAMSLLNLVTYMLFGVGYAIYALVKEHKRVTGKNININELQSRLTAVEGELDQSRSALSTINKTIEDFNNGK